MQSLSENAKNRLKEILPGFSAYGFSLHGMSANENVLFATDKAIVVKYSEELIYLFACYDFDPDSIKMNNQKNAFEKVKVLIIKHSLGHPNTSASYERIPHWVKNFNSLECLILENVDLQNGELLEGLRLKFLGIENAETKDIRRLIHVIGKIGSLEFLMYSSIFSEKDISELKQILPNLSTFHPNRTQSFGHHR